MIDVRRPTLDQLSAIASQGAQCADFGIGAKRPLQEAECMQLLKPLSVVPITLAPRDGLDMPRIDQIGCDACLFEQLVDRDPKDPGRLHGDCVDATGNEPNYKGVQISRKGLKHADWFGITIGWDCDDDFFAADIKSSGIGMDTGEFIESALTMGRS